MFTPGLPTAARAILHFWDPSGQLAKTPWTILDLLQRECAACCVCSPTAAEATATNIHHQWGSKLNPTQDSVLNVVEFFVMVPFISILFVIWVLLLKQACKVFQSQCETYYCYY